VSAPELDAALAETRLMRERLREESGRLLGLAHRDEEKSAKAGGVVSLVHEEKSAKAGGVVSLVHEERAKARREFSALLLIIAGAGPGNPEGDDAARLRRKCAGLAGELGSARAEADRLRSVCVSAAATLAETRTGRLRELARRWDFDSRSPRSPLTADLEHEGAMTRRVLAGELLAALNGDGHGTA
jgi:hypothetical protein